MTTMLGFLTVLFCATVVWANVTPIPTFKLDGMKGKWYSLGVATNAKWFATHKAHMKMGTIEIIPTVDGDLNMTVTILNSNGTCWKTNHLAKKTNISGQFTCHSDRSGSDNVIRIIDANFEEYAILHVTQTKEGQSSVLIKLYSRKKTMCKCVEDKFWKHSKDSGIEKENVLIFPPSHSEC